MSGAKASTSAARGGVPGRPDPEARALEAAAAETLRRGGGALPVERLRADLAGSDPGRERLRRCLSGRADLFLVVEHAPGPWSGQEDWTRGECQDYGTAGAAGDSVILLEGSAAGPGAPAPAVPAVLRESLLAMWGEAPEDDELRRELGRAVSPSRPGPSP